MSITKDSKYLKAKTANENHTIWEYEIDIHSHLEEIFDVLPRKSIIDKGRCGIGGTYLEIKAERNSIIVVPTNSIIDNKCYDENGVLRKGFFVVRGKEKKGDQQRLRDFLTSDQTKKIFTTPESLSKIVNWSSNRGQLFKEWFLLFDECHTAISDNFRKNILNAFKYFFKFDNSALISATPYRFSTPKLKCFDRHIVRFDSAIGQVRIYSTENVGAVLHLLLTHPEDYLGRVHIFLNSVNKIADCIRMAQLTDCSIFCKDDKDNMGKLNELQTYFKDAPKELNFSKFNFYTSKYFEGWDLDDQNTTIIIVSDVHSLTLKSGISNKCVQAAGRNRKHSNKIIHLTNDYGTPEFTPFQEIEDENTSRAKDVITQYITHKVNGKGLYKADDDFTKAVIKYSDLEDGQPVINEFKIDQHVNIDYCNQQYNHPKYIRKAWKEAGFKVIMCEKKVPPIPVFNVKMKLSHKIRISAEYLSSLDAIDPLDFPHSEDLYKMLPTEFDEYRKFYQELGKDVMIRLNYSYQSIRRAYIVSINDKLKAKITDGYWSLVGQQPKTNEEIKDILSNLYAQYGVLDPRNAVNTAKQAFAANLDDYFTKVKKVKVNGAHGFKIAIK